MRARVVWFPLAVAVWSAAGPRTLDAQDAREDTTRALRFRSLVSAQPGDAINRGPTRVTLAIEESKVAITATVSVKDWKTDRTEHGLQLAVSGPITSAPATAALFSESGVATNASIGFKYSLAFLERAPLTTRQATRGEAVRTIYNGDVAARGTTTPTEQTRIALRFADNPKDVTVLGIDVAASKPGFDFVDPSDTTLAAQSVSRTAFRAAIGLGRTSDRIRGLYGVTYEYDVSFEAGGKANLCRPIPGTTSSRCSEATFGGPTRAAGSVVSAEVRTFFSSVALAPRLSWSSARSRLAFTLPLYLFQSEKGSFVGGVSTTLVEGEKSIRYAIFIGRALGRERWW